jgi:formyl-CoA transferase
MGISSVCGYTPEMPSKIGQSYPDFIATWSGLLMIVSALVDRLSTGLGQWIDLGMYQLGPVVIPEAIIAAQTADDVPRPSGNREYGALYSAVVPGPRDGEWIAVSVPGPGEWASLRGALEGLPVDPPATQDGLLAVDARLQDWFTRGDADASLASLRGLGVAASRVANARDLVRDAHLATRGFYETVDFGPEIGVRRLVGRPYRWEGAHRVGIDAPGASWGADTTELLESLGYESQVAEFLEHGVTATKPVGATTAPPADLDDLLRTGVHDFIDPNYRDPALFAR